MFMPTESSRSLGMTIIGSTGMGKSAFLHNLVMDDIKAGRSAIVFDPHNDLTKDILESVPAEHADRVAVLAVSETMPFGLNLYECQNPSSSLAIDRVVDNSILVFKRMMQSENNFHPHIEYLLSNTAYTILANPAMTMAEIVGMYADTPLGEMFRKSLLSHVDDENVHTFWNGVEGRKGNMAYQYIEPLLNKVTRLTTSKTMRLIVGQEHTTIPFSDYLDQEGKTLLIHLPIGELGEEKTQVLGMMLLSVLSEQIYERVRQRKERRLPLHLYIDEAGKFATSGSAISKLLKEGRKFGVATHLAFQTFADLPDKEAQSAVLQTGTLAIFHSIGGLDADILSKQLQVKQPPVDPVPRMRLVPNVKEWTTTEWTNEEKKAEYYKLSHELFNVNNLLKGFLHTLDWFETALQNAFPPSDESGFPKQKISSGELLSRLVSNRSPDNGYEWSAIFQVKEISEEQQRIRRSFNLESPQFRIIAALENAASYGESAFLNDIPAKLRVKIWYWNREQRFEEARIFLRDIVRDIMAHPRVLLKMKWELECELKLIKGFYCLSVSHKEQDGWIPVKLEEERISKSYQERSGARGKMFSETTTIGTKDTQLYDMAQGTSRPVSDIWNEMQANLATLPPYTCYIQYINDQKEITETQIVTAPPPIKQDDGEEQAEQILQRSRIQFGTPAEIVKQRMVDRVKPFLDPPKDSSATTVNPPKNPKGSPPEIERGKPYKKV